MHKICINGYPHEPVLLCALAAWPSLAHKLLSRVPSVWTLDERVKTLEARLCWLCSLYVCKRERVLPLCLSTLVVLLLAIDALVSVFFVFHPE